MCARELVLSTPLAYTWTMTASSELDHNNKVYPSIDGLVHQIVDALEEGNDFSWYSFKHPTFGPGENEVHIDAVSYDEAGEEENFYHVKIVVEEIK